MRNRFALSALIILLVLLALALTGCERDRPVPTPNPNIATPAPTSAPEAGATGEGAPTSSGSETEQTGAASPAPASGTSSAEQPPQPITPTGESGAASTSGTGGTQGAGTTNVYVVTTGDTLNAIARKHGVTPQALLAANPSITNPDVLKVGIQIIIPVQVVGQGTTQAATPETGQVVEQGAEQGTAAQQPAEQGASQGAAGQQPTMVYTVQKGDTLSSIAQKFGVSVKQLQQLNNISDPDTIYVGQKLLIPATTSTPGQSAQGKQTYVVQKGDTLNSIATRYGVTTAQLQKANNISDPNKIYPGQVLVIP